jgi:apolipoprotein N-acyltransferase
LALFWLKVFGLFVPFIVSVILALGFGLFCLIYKLIKPKLSISDVILLPIIWVAIEYLRSLIFPAGILGYSQYLNIPLIQIADITGVMSISFLVIFSNAMIFTLITEYTKKRTIKLLVIFVTIIGITYSYGFYSMAKTSGKDVLKVALIQSNLIFNSPTDYNSKKTLNILGDLTTKAAKEKPSLIIWPETVIREEMRMDPFVSQSIHAIARKSKSYLLIGNPDIQIKENKVKHYNSAFLISPDGKVIRQYNKIFTVPFWEILPLRSVFPYFRNVETKGEFDRGSEFTVFKTPFGNFSALICFEGIFGDHVRRFVNSGAEFLVNISNDGWSRSRTEHWQHASMNVFRAVENRTYYVRVGNTGITGVIDKTGRFVKAMPPYDRGYWIGEIGGASGRTLYTRFGDVFGWACLLATVIMVIIVVLKPLQRRESR